VLSQKFYLNKRTFDPVMSKYHRVHFSETQSVKSRWLSW